MSQLLPPAEQPPESRNSLERLPQKPSLSSQFFNDAELSSAFQKLHPATIQKVAASRDLIIDNHSSASGKNTALLPSALKITLAAGDVLHFSTPIDNLADGSPPDYRLALGRDNKLRLEPGKTGDPLSDGKVNIELETGNKSLPDALKNGDKDLHESLREIMSYWLSKHPDKSYPSWWQDFLSSKSQIPENAKTITIERTPIRLQQAHARIPAPPAAPKEGWQHDYRSGSGHGYGSSSSGAYYSGNGDGSAPAYELPNELSKYSDPRNFVSRVTEAILRNDEALNEDGSPRYQAFIANENGGISVGLRHWHAGGALPELLNAWQEKNPEKFEQFFHGYSPAQINALSAGGFAAHAELVQGMKEALADSEYQSVQSKLMTDWVTRQVKLGADMGIKCERDLANYVGLADLFGQNKANQAAIDARPENAHPKEVDSVIHSGEFANPYLCIKVDFSMQDTMLKERTPAPGVLGQKLAKRVQFWHGRMHSTGHCALAVQRALADVGLGQFLGCGDAWNMLTPLERSGLFVRVPEAHAAVGDLILRPPSKDARQDSVYGDISVLTDRKGNQIIQTNDASYEFDRANPRYDGKAVFLRYVGDDNPHFQRHSAQHTQLKQHKLQ